MRKWKPSLLGYRWVMKNIGFFLFLAVLAVIYIYNGHYADKISRDITRTDKEVKELEYEYKTLKSEVMFRSKQSELAKTVEPLGLKELTVPPAVLVSTTPLASVTSPVIEPSFCKGAVATKPLKLIVPLLISIICPAPSWPVPDIVLSIFVSVTLGAVPEIRFSSLSDNTTCPPPWSVMPF